MDLTDAMDPSGIIEDTLCKRRLPCVNMGDDTDVSDLFDPCFSGHGRDITFFSQTRKGLGNPLSQLFVNLGRHVQMSFSLAQADIRLVRPVEIAPTSHEQGKLLGQF